MSTYVVVIPYREPTYEMRHGGRRERPFLARYEVKAADEEGAIAHAVARFEQDARESSVGWVREIEREGIRVRPSA